jgi:hypothetical protein
VLFHQENALCHKLVKTTAKLHELSYELFPHSPYCPDLAFSDLFLFADLKRMLAGKNLALIKRSSSKIWSILRLFRNRSIKMVSKNGMTAIIIVSLSKETILNTKTDFYQKKCVLLC